MRLSGALVRSPQNVLKHESHCCWFNDSYEEKRERAHDLLADILLEYFQAFSCQVISVARLIESISGVCVCVCVCDRCVTHGKGAR